MRGMGPSIAPEKLLRASLLQAFYSIRSERQLMEQLDYNLLFRWFVGLAMDAPVWDASTFSKNRERLPARTASGCQQEPRAAASKNRERLPARTASGCQQEPRAASSKNRERLLAGDVAQKLLAAVVGQPRVRALTPPGRPGLGMTDPDARLARKSDGQSSILAYAGHVLMGRAEP